MNSRDIARNERAAHELLAIRRPRVQQRLPRERRPVHGAGIVLSVALGLALFAVFALVLVLMSK